MIGPKICSNIDSKSKSCTKIFSKIQSKLPYFLRSNSSVPSVDAEPPDSYDDLFSNYDIDADNDHFSNFLSCIEIIKYHSQPSYDKWYDVTFPTYRYAFVFGSLTESIQYGSSPISDVLPATKIHPVLPSSKARSGDKPGKKLSHGRNLPELWY